MLLLLLFLLFLFLLLLLLLLLLLFYFYYSDMDKKDTVLRLLQKYLYNSNCQGKLKLLRVREV